MHIHRASTAQDLVGALVDVIARPRRDDDVFLPEVVSVPTRGIERWIAQELSQRLGATDGRSDGIAANLVFPFPATLIDWAVRADDAPVDLHGRRPHDNPWAPERLAWTLLSVIEDPADPLDVGAFGTYLSSPHGRLRRMSALKHVAGLFHRYAVHRPEMIRAWAQNSDGSAADVDGTGQTLDDAAAWQPRLWRAARRHLGPSFAEQTDAAAHRLADGPVPGLPHRVSVYGLTALPATYAELLKALGTHHDVHLFLLHPSPALWDRIRSAGQHVSAGTLRSDDPTVATPDHPLLTSWARDTRELQLVLSDIATSTILEESPTTDTPNTLLERLQHDIRTDIDPEQTTPLVLPVDPDTNPAQTTDTSLQVHGCHGQIRQVEVLRDVILGLMSDDPTIQPRDIVVMCPDVETFAPLVQAVFDADADAESPADPDPATQAARSTDPTPAPEAGAIPDIRVRVADRALRAVNPLLRSLADILELPDGRFEASTAVDLLRQAPVMARFRLSAGDLETIEGWIDDVDIRWGLDVAHRQQHRVPTGANTWHAGLQRLLLGVAVPEEGPRTIGGVLPHDDVEGTVVDVAGRFAEFVDRVGLVITYLADPRPISEWAADLQAAATLLCDARGPHAWQAIQLAGLLQDLVTRAGGTDVPVGLTELRNLLADDLQGRPTRANHRSGDLTVCTLVPMRSVPYRVVCLLGIDDGAFPRRSVPFGDDLIARHPHIGDHDPRTEDRQLLLDALLAARQHLVITYRARDERTGQPLPAAVPVAELLDVVDATATLPDAPTATAPDAPTATAPDATAPGLPRDLIVRHHPLHAADPRSFQKANPFGFDPLALEGARARAAGPKPATPFVQTLPTPLTPVRPITIDYGDLARFLADPLGTFLRERLAVSYPRDDTPPDDLLSLQLDPLEKWEVGHRLVEGALRGDLDTWSAAETARGSLPAGQIGEQALNGVRKTMDGIVEAVTQAGMSTADLLDQPSRRIGLDVTVGGVQLVGAVEGVGDTSLVRIDYGSPKPKRRLKAWLDWLMLQAAGQGRPAVLVTSGNGKKKNNEILIRYPDTLTVDLAKARLRVLVDLYRRGLDRPLPLFTDASGTFVHDHLAPAGRSKKTPLERAEAAASGSWHSPFGEAQSRVVQTVFGPLSFQELYAMPALDDEQGEGWNHDHPGRFARLAWRMWHPVYDDVLIQDPDA